MSCDNSGTMWALMKCINDGIEIPYALERAATNCGINIEHLREVIEDVNKEDELINGESWEAGIPYPEDEDFRDSDSYPGGLSLLYGDD